MLRRIASVFLLCAGTIGGALATPAHAAGTATIDVTGVWGFQVGQNYCFPTCHRTFILNQNGTTIRGTDGTDPITGNVSGNVMQFTVRTGISEDNSTFTVHVGSGSQVAVGTIVNQIEPPGFAVGAKVSGGA